MSGWCLQLRTPPPLRLDLRGISPAALAGLTSAQVQALPVPMGATMAALGEFFDPSALADETTLRLEGDLSRVDRIGWQLDGGRIEVHGSVGHYAGAGMRGGDMTVRGDAADLAACEMAGGRIEITGDAGDFGASTLPGSMDGMRGGTFIVRGSVGARFGDRMRRGTAVVGGDAGDFLASRLIAGTIAVAGRCGAHVGYGMRRGTLVLAGTVPDLSLRFVASGSEPAVFWQLLARDLAARHGAFEGLAGRRTRSLRGDVSAGGQGECIQLI